MIEHLCFFKMKPEVGEPQMRQIMEMFHRLKGVIPGIIDVNCGINITEETQFADGYGMGLRMRFETHDHLRQYLIHPEHVKVSEFVFSCISHVSVCDFEV